MTPLEVVLDRLRDRGLKTKRSGGEWIAQCPSHEDKTPSLSLGEGADLKLLAHCHAGCETERIARDLGMSMSEFFVNHETKSNGDQITATYDYTDEEGELLFQSVRYFPKRFRQRKPNGKGRWIWEIKGVRRVLYRLPEVGAETNQVYVVEGEKDADRLAKLGVVATTNPMGAGKWEEEYTSQLRHVAQVVVVADQDEKGRQHAAEVVASLRLAGITVTLVEGLVWKDVSDHLDAGHSLDQLVTVELVPDGLPRQVDLETLMSGERPAREWCMEPISPAGLLVGIVAKRGDRKSLLNLFMAGCRATGQAVLHQPASDPIHVAYIDQEMGEDDLYDRLSDFGWNPDHPDWSKLKEHLHYYQLIDLPPLDTEEGGEMLERIVDRDGARLVVIDTLSRVVTGGENDNDTFKSLYRHTEIRLKRKGVTVHRLDHLGKDPAKGSRGGSAKEDSLDVVWQMERSSAENTVILTKTKGRQDGYPARLTIHLTTVNGVTSFTTADKMPDWLPDLVAQVDALGLPDSTGVPTVQKALKDAGIGRRRADLVLVVRFRKAREHLGNTPWEQFREHPGTQPEETLMNVDETEWEHPREHPGTPGVGVSHPIGGNTPWPGVETDDDYEPTLDDLESVDDYPLEEVEL